MGSPFQSKTEHHSLTKKMVGAYIPIGDAHRLALLSVRNGDPRSKQLKSMIDDYLKDKPDLHELIDELAQVAADHWKDLEKEKKGGQGWKGVEQIKNRYKSFIEDTRKDLERHRIHKYLINQIIRDIKGKVKL